MNLWIVNHYAVSPGVPGGTRHYSLARELLRRGHEVTLVASSVDYMRREAAYLQLGEQARLEVIGEVPFLWLRTPAYKGNSLRRVGNMLAFAYRLRREAPRHLARPDVIVGSTPHLFAAWAAYRLARRYQVPFVLEVRDLWPQTLIDLGGFSRYHPFIVLLALLERMLYRRAQAVVTLLPGGVEYIAHKRGNAQGIYWVPNGVDLSLIPEPVPPPPEPPFTVMYAGAHGLANNLDVALRAARLLQEQGAGKQILFRFIGDGPEKPRLIEQAQAWDLRNVVFEDPVSKEDVYSLLQQAHAFLMILRDSPLYRWGISLNKMYDYMAMGRPILFCGETTYNPIKANQAGVTLPPNDPVALAMAIRELTQTSAKERRAMGLRARAYVEKEHDLRQLAGRFEEVLRDVVAL